MKERSREWTSRAFAAKIVARARRCRFRSMRRPATRHGRGQAYAPDSVERGFYAAPSICNSGDGRHVGVSRSAVMSRGNGGSLRSHTEAIAGAALRECRAADHLHRWHVLWGSMRAGPPSVWIFRAGSMCWRCARARRKMPKPPRICSDIWWSTASILRESSAPGN
jgi:hypothetical protein